MPNYAEMSKSEIVESLERRQSRANRERALERQSEQQMMGFAVGALASGALGADGLGLLPDDIYGIDTDLFIAVGLFFLARRAGARYENYLRGASYGIGAGGLQDTGAKLGKFFTQ